MGNPTLLAFYGDRAEEAQRALREHGIDPDQLRPLPEWDSVRGRLEDDMRMDADHVATATEALVDWTEELDEEFLEERFGFTGVVDAILLGDVADIADPINLEISVRAADALGRIDRCLEDKFHGEGFQRAPYKIVLDERAQGARLHTGQAMLGGWAVAWDVQREECPGVQESLVECRRLAAQRDREIARLLGDSR